ncbi:hypothetical protein B0A48_01869 [Cryoendolithus antarcticus]|uniref:Fe2OG dioxygenase domain-containing protein n=1 Tax=Cryoendolithus antarcticus TaxID=1507870 RepID=A0A1V8TQI6_9PEZI|nr:hypothetical protein B0A48_01869 [Cryoendolithus antarcticus]
MRSFNDTEDIDGRSANAKDQSPESIPILDLSWADDPTKKPELLTQLRAALFDVGFLYISNHGVTPAIVSELADRLPSLFGLPSEEKARLSKLNSPHFLGYSGFAEETTLGKQDQREQFDFATELPVVWREIGDSENAQLRNAQSRHARSEHAQSGNAHSEKAQSDHSQSGNAELQNTQSRNDQARDFTQLYWRLRGPNQWPQKHSLRGFRAALEDYHDALAQLSHRFVHLIEEAFEIPVGTYDHLFGKETRHDSPQGGRSPIFDGDDGGLSCLPPQHRLKLLRYPPSSDSAAQGVGAHKDSSGWLTFLYQHGTGPGLETLSSTGAWLSAPPIPGTFVVNFGNAFEAATEGAVKATVHRVVSPGPGDDVRYSIPFFMGLPLDVTVSEIRAIIPEKVRRMRKDADSRAKTEISTFLDPRWDSLGESQLRKWIRSHHDVGLKWYGQNVVDYYTF